MSNIKDLFVSYEIAKKLKEKGFNEPCLAYTVTDNIRGDQTEMFKDGAILRNSETPVTTAPLYQQVVDWFREEHNIIPISKICSNNKYLNDVVKNNMEEETIFSTKSAYHKTYYEALTKAIEEAIKLIDDLSNQKVNNCPEH